MDRFQLFLVLTAGIAVLQLIWILTTPKNYKWGISNYFNPQVMLHALMIGSPIIISVISFFLFPLPAIPLNNFFVLNGILLYIIGFIIAVWAKLEMKNFWELPARHEHRRQNKLITTGPFSFSRNPIYMGFILIFLGFSLALKSYLVFLIIPYLIMVNYVIEKEEKILTKHFGKEYLEYKKRVRRFI